MGVGKVIAGIVVAVGVIVTCGMVAAQVQPAGKNSVKAVRFGKLWDGKGKVWTNAIVIVEGGKIRSVGTEASAIPAGAEVIDLSKYSGMPGLIDSGRRVNLWASFVIRLLE